MQRCTITVTACNVESNHLIHFLRRYWVEQGEKYYKHHPNVTALKSLLGEGNKNGHSNGKSAGASSEDVSPETTAAGASTTAGGDDSILWSSSFVNGTRRNPIQRLTDTPDQSTPLRNLLADAGTPQTGSGRRFAPRPSPERLAAQVLSVEATQEKIMELMADQNRRLVDEIKTHRAVVVEELATQRQALLDEMKTHRQTVVDLKIETKQGLHDLKMEVSKVCQAVRESAATAQQPPPPQKITVQAEPDRELRALIEALPARIAKVMPPPASAQPPQQSPRPIGVAELQECMAQQTAILQMSGLGFAAAGAGAMFARPPPPAAVAAAAAAATPPHAVVPPAAQPPPPTGAATTPVPPQPPIFKPPVPGADAGVWTPPTPQQVLAAESSAANAASLLPKVPLPPTSAVTASPVSAETAQPRSPHGFQINMPKNVTPAVSPFKEQDGPACPVTTTAIMSNIAPPLFSAVADDKSKPTPTPAAAAAAPTTSTSSWGDKFKPAAGSWECGGCFTRNNKDVIQCPACETPQPGKEEEVKAKKEAEKPKMTFGAGGGFKFGGGGAAAAPTTTGSSGFSFGGAPASSAAPAASGGFRFGSTTTTATPAAAPTSATGSHLSFADQGLKLNTKEDAKPVAEKIEKFADMKELTFSGNTVGIDAASVLGKALEKHPEFERAYWKDMFTGRMKTEIPPALIHLGAGIMAANARLVELDLSDNAFGPIGVDGLKELLKSPSCFTLRELRLNNTGCGVTGGKALAKLLKECYEASKRAGSPLALRVFVLGRSRQENDGATALAEVFKLMGSLEEVVMPQNGIYHEGIAALTDAFAANPNLRILNMNDNTFTPMGARCLADVLPKLQKLRVLNLGDCLLKTEGAQVIADALKTGHADLEELYLDSNEIRVEAGLAIAEAVANKGKLETLTIHANHFGEEGRDQVMNKLAAVGKDNLLGEDPFEDDEEPDSEDEDEGNEEEEEDENGNEEEDETEPAAPVAAEQKGIFAAAAASPFANIAAGTAGFSFGKTQQDSPFGAAASANTSSASTSIFGTPKADTGASPSFASIAAGNSGFSFGKPADSKFSFAGAGSSLFGNKATGASPSKQGEDEDGVVEEGPDPHFEPIIPLPELVQVTTGEEEEDVVFSHRGKVYRYDPETKQWKDRGVGDLKILNHKTKNTFRVLLRRDQTLKVACNHLINTDMKLEPMFGSENAVTWFAMDHTDDEPKMEKLAAKFKLVETKDAFKKKFEECQKLLKDGPTSGANTEETNEAPAASASATTPEAPAGASTNTTSASTSLFGGSANTSSASPSIFGGSNTGGGSSFATIAAGNSGFSFGKPADSKFSFAGAGSSIFGAKGAGTSPAKQGDEDDGAVEDNPDPHFEPIIPLPELIQVTTGEEDEDIVFSHRGKVYRYDPETKQWKDRGVGDLKILSHKTKNTFRVLLRRDQTHKVACNHLINTDMKLEPMFGSENAITWFAMDHTDDEPKMEKLAAKFKLVETKDDFKKKFEECQKRIKEGPASDAGKGAANAAPAAGDGEV